MHAGGDNVDGGMIMGLIVGVSSYELPSHLIEGLVFREELETEIDAL